MENSYKVKVAIKKAFEYFNSLSDEEFEKELKKYEDNHDPLWDEIAETILQQRIYGSYDKASTPKPCER